MNNKGFLVRLLTGLSLMLVSSASILALPNIECDQATVEISDELFSGGDVLNCRASSQMQIGPNQVFPTNSNLFLVAPQIALQSNTSIVEGATLALVAAVPEPNQAVLGPLSGAEINAYRLTDLNNPVEGPVTANTSTSDLNLAGAFQLSLREIPQDEWILVTATGGRDIDVDDDGVADTMPTENLGTIHAIAPVRDWVLGRARINLLTEIAYRAVEDDLSQGNLDDLEGKLDWVATILFSSDITADGDLSTLDLIAFHPAFDFHRSSLEVPYDALITENDQGDSVLKSIMENREPDERTEITKLFRNSLNIPSLPALVAVNTSINLHASSTNTRATTSIESYISDDGSIFDGSATLMRAEDSSGNILALTFGVPGQTAEFSAHSTALALIMLNAGGPRDAEGFQDWASIALAHSDFNILTSEMESALLADPLFLSNLENHTSIVAKVHAIGGAVRDVASQSTTNAAGLLQAALGRMRASWPTENSDFYCMVWPCSDWHEHEPWIWYGEATGAKALFPDSWYEVILQAIIPGWGLSKAYITTWIPEFASPPFLAVQKDDKTHFALANPGAANFSFEMYDARGILKGWRVTPRNSTLIQKLLNSGAAQRSLRAVEYKVGWWETNPADISSDVVHVRFDRYPNLIESPARGSLLLFLNGAHLTVSTLNLVSDFSAISDTLQGITKNEKAVRQLLTCARDLVNTTDIFYDSSQPGDILGQLEGFIKYNFYSLTETMLSSGNCMNLALREVAKHVDWGAIVTKAAGKAAIDAKLMVATLGVKAVFDAANDLIPVATSVIMPSAGEADYYLSWGENKENEPTIENVTLMKPPLKDAEITFTPNPVNGSTQKESYYYWYFDMNIYNPNSEPIKVLAISSFGQSSCASNMTDCDHGPDGYWPDFPDWFADSSDACTSKTASNGSKYLEISPFSSCSDNWWTRSNYNTDIENYYWVWTEADSRYPEVIQSEKLILKAKSVPTGGLIAYYEFEGNTNDSSGNGHHAVALGDINYSTGIFGYAASFTRKNDGMRAIDTHAYLDGKKQVSVATWVKYDALGNTESIASHRYLALNDTNTQLILYKRSNNSLCFRVYGIDSESNFTSDTACTSTIVSADSWYHLAAVYDGMNISIYLNGSIEETVLYSDPIRTVPGADLNIAFNSENATSQRLGGDLDDFRFYDRAITPEEVYSLSR